MKAYVLLSGGIDSMSCVNFYKTLGYEVECIFCDYGQPALIPEKQASKKIAAYFEVPYETIEVKNINIPQCHYTYSCETGSVPPCGRCLSCLDRKEFLHG